MLFLLLITLYNVMHNMFEILIILTLDETKSDEPW